MMLAMFSLTDLVTELKFKCMWCVAHYTRVDGCEVYKIVVKVENRSKRTSDSQK